MIRFNALQAVQQTAHTKIVVRFKPWGKKQKTDT
jgi:hypothetical protein